MTRRNLIRLGCGAVTTAASFSRFGAINALAQGSSNYKALVCVFMFGGNDSHNMVVPQASADFTAYKTARGSLALPDGNTSLLPITATSGTPYAFNSGLMAIHPLWAQQKLAVVANVGMLVQPTTRAQFLASTAPVPTNLFSHSDQVLSMQSGIPTSGGGTGWAGRVADAVNGLNGSASFPSSISMSGPALFCTGNIVQSASLIPNFDNALYGFNYWPATAAAAQKTAYQEILTLDSGLAVIQAANKVRQDAINLEAMLKSAGNSPAFTTTFPGTGIGQQLLQVAKIIQLRAMTGMSRQVFFCSIGGFDTHGSQSWEHWNLLKTVSEAMAAFYNATAEMGVADKVTSFTESDFGRTLQPSGTGSDHGWGSHCLVMGGAVKGGNLYGQFPSMALGGPDDSGSRGAMIPTTSLDQYGATMAKWFGLSDPDLAVAFPNLSKFGSSNLGFV
jgi:uncharacterized protein (DUF1501 family)